MAIVITNLEKISKEKALKQYEYKDLRLDFSIAESISNTTSDTNKKNDCAVDYDLKAIENSLKSAFNTRPGQRFLFPDYGMDLETFLFEPITEEISGLISRQIKNTIEKYESRIRIKDVIVTPDIDNQRYDISIVALIPVFNTAVSIAAELNIKQQGFNILLLN